MERDFWIFTCVCVYVITGFGYIPLSSGRRDSVELLPLPSGYISVLVHVCVCVVLSLSVARRSIVRDLYLHLQALCY